MKNKKNAHTHINALVLKSIKFDQKSATQTYNIFLARTTFTGQDNAATIRERIIARAKRIAVNAQCCVHTQKYKTKNFVCSLCLYSANTPLEHIFLTIPMCMYKLYWWERERGRAQDWRKFNSRMFPTIRSEYAIAVLRSHFTVVDFIPFISLSFFRSCWAYLCCSNCVWSLVVEWFFFFVK